MPLWIKYSRRLFSTTVYILSRNLDFVHIYWGASAVLIEQVHLHCSRLLRNLDFVHIYCRASAMQIEQVHLHCSRLLRIFTA